MRYKCHYCESPLNNGIIYTLYCKNCGRCSITLDNKSGKITSYNFSIFENGRDTNIIRIENNYKPRSYCIYNGEYISIPLNIPIQLDETNTPLVYDLWDKIKILILFKN